MVARLFTCGLATALSFMVTLGLAPLNEVQAAGNHWSSPAMQGKRPQFRPWNRSVRRPTTGQWRPHSGKSTARRTTYATGASAAAWSRVYRVRRAVDSGGLLGGRKPDRVARRPIPGVSFRPHRPGGALVPSPASTGWYPSGHADAGLHAQFRPARLNRRPRYESSWTGGHWRSHGAERTSAYQTAQGLPARGYGTYRQVR